MTRRNANNYNMSSKRKRRQSSSNKQIQRIKTRLIEISMKTEDYVYHRVPISEFEAEMFIREVSSYKTECSKDERSLQVIEKLTRCMKAIIAEHQEQKFGCPTNYVSADNNTQSYMNSNRTTTSSPVYSISDDDRTQLTQTPSDFTINKNIEYYKPFGKIQVTNTEHDMINNNNNIADDNSAIDISKDLAKINSTINIQKALSNLSIGDVKFPDEGMDIDHECSQSILINYEVINDVAQIMTPEVNLSSHIVDNGKIVADIDRTSQSKTSQIFNPATTVSTGYAKAFVSNDVQHNKTDNGVYNLNHPLVAKVSKALIKILNTEKVSPREKDKRPKTIVTNPTKSPKQQCSTNTVSNYNLNNKKISNITCDSNETQLKIPKMIKPLINKSQRKNDDAKKTVIAKKKRRPQKTKLSTAEREDNTQLVTEDFTQKNLNIVNNNNTCITAPKRQCTTKKRNANISIPIYNKNVVSDLSWLENIRYVREIGEDEYDKLTNLNESFWDNYDLPPNFDDADFNL